MGGAVKAIEKSYMQNEIAASAYKYQDDIEKGTKVIVGVNKFGVEEKQPDNLFRVDDSIRQYQMEKLKKVKAERNNEKVKASLQKLEQYAKGDNNLMPAIVEACENYVSLGEIADTLRGVFGKYK
jgi:methylmalonyl-CoA mutase N-terminal domain/subunit